MVEIPEPSDAELVVGTLSSRIEEFDTLMDRHLPRLISFFHYLGVPLALIDDLAQETFFRAYRKLDLYDTTRPFSSWLLTIGRNVFVDERRQAKKDSRIAQNHMDNSPPPSLEDAVIKRNSARELLDALDEGSRFLLEMRLFQNLPFADIGKMTGESEATMRVRYHRLLKRLRLSASSSGEENEH